MNHNVIHAMKDLVLDKPNTTNQPSTKCTRSARNFNIKKKISKDHGLTNNSQAKLNSMTYTPSSMARLS